MQQSIPVQVTECLEAELEHMIALLERLVRAESPSSVPEAQNDILALLDAELAVLDYDTTRVYGRTTGGYLYARPDKRRHDHPFQLLLGLCDTVWPPGTIEEMPFEVENGIARGPGATQYDPTVL